MIISLSVFVSDNKANCSKDCSTVEIQYYSGSPPPDNEYEKFSLDNKNNMMERITIKNVPDDSTVGELKKTIFEHEKNAEKFAMHHQIIGCQQTLVLADNDKVDICMTESDSEFKILVYLFLKKVDVKEST